LSGFDLDRFVEAQRPVYAAALAELERGRKQSHWMWFVFPQMAGLGRSATALHYAIRSLEEAQAYSAHPLLGARLRQCCEAAMSHGTGAEALFGPVDAIKFRSSMTLFERAAPSEQLFAKCLDRFFGGARDEATLRLLPASAI
jgi:uncharacterized protein (DUF1810 family)